MIDVNSWHTTIRPRTIQIPNPHITQNGDSIEYFVELVHDLSTFDYSSCQQDRQVILVPIFL